VPPHNLSEGACDGPGLAIKLNPPIPLRFTHTRAGTMAAGRRRWGRPIKRVYQPRPCGEKAVMRHYRWSLVKGSSLGGEIRGDVPVEGSNSDFYEIFTATG
jgi:hypothetical protein